MKYLIKYNYNTGNSYQIDYGIENVLELEWTNLEIAKKNLKRIEEHYKQYKELEEWRGREKQEILKENQNKDWFVKIIKDCIYYDNNGKKTYSCIDKSQIERYKNNKTVELGTFIDLTTAQNQIILYTDDNKKFQFWCPWCGYFEKLNYCKIIVKPIEELKIMFHN